MSVKLRTFDRKRYSISSDRVVDIETSTSLSTIIKNDLLYGVGSRPSLPCCFEDEDELNQDSIDPLADVRHDAWHDASVGMNPQFSRTEQTIEVGSQVDTTTTDDISKDE